MDVQKERKRIKDKLRRGSATAADKAWLAAHPVRRGRPPKDAAKQAAPPPADEPKPSEGPQDLPGVDLGGTPAEPKEKPINAKREALIETFAGTMTSILDAANSYNLDKGGLALPKDGQVHDVFFAELKASWKRIADKWIPEDAGTETLDEYVAFGTTAIVLGQSAYFSFKEPPKRKAPAPAPAPAPEQAAAPTPTPTPDDFRDARPQHAGASLGALVAVTPASDAA